MKLLNRYKKYRNRSVRLMITSIIISHTHEPLQLCSVAPQLCSPSMSLQIVIWSDTTELQWCMGVANNYTCYRQLYRLVPVLFTPVQLCTFLNFGGKFLCLVVFYCQPCYQVDMYKRPQNTQSPQAVYFAQRIAGQHMGVCLNLFIATASVFQVASPRMTRTSFSSFFSMSSISREALWTEMLARLSTLHSGLVHLFNFSNATLLVSF